MEISLPSCARLAKHYVAGCGWTVGFAAVGKRAGAQGKNKKMISFGTIASKIFGSANDRRVRNYQPRVDAINALEPI